MVFIEQTLGSPRSAYNFIENLQRHQTKGLDIVLLVLDEITLEKKSPQVVMTVVT